MTGLTPSSGGVLIDIRVVPRASRNEIKREPDGSIKVRVQAPPADGKANRAVAKLIAKTLRVPARGISVAAGATSRTKRILVQGIDAAEVRERLGL